MENASAYLPQDRRAAIKNHQELPEQALGAVLFADISGFTPLTNALVQQFGARRGADQLTRQLNQVYTALIDQVDRFGGSVIGFSGDAIACWFPGQSIIASAGAMENALAQATLRAVASALGMQAAMARFHTLTLAESVTVNLAIKTSVAAGVTRRFLVGEPQIQRIDVLAGSTLERMAAAEALAQKSELVLDGETATLVQDQVVVQEWRSSTEAHQRFAVIAALQATVEPAPLTHQPITLTETQARPWVLPALHQRLQSEQSRFLAEMRPATALFLKFAGLDFDDDADAGVKLDAYIRWVQGVIDRYEGALIQLTTGDKGSYLYATFGAPIAHDDDSIRAVTAALILRTPPAHCDFISSTQIGISQGMMRVGAYGSTSRRTYGVLGDETIVAARLMGEAGPGQIFVSEAVAEAVADHVRLLPLGTFKLKGKTEAQPLYSVLGVQNRASHRLSKLYAAPLVGRHTELTQMVEVLTPVAQGQGQLLRIEGSAGIGKSHLVATFVKQVEESGFDMALAACQSTAQDMAYFAGRQIARTLFLLDEAESEINQVSQIEAALRALNPAWLVRMPLLGDLLGLPIPDNPTTAAFDPRLRQEALISLAVDIVQARASQKPLLLLFEDIHWMDEASQGMLLALARVVTVAPILLVLVQRPPSREDEGFLSAVAALPNQTPIVLTELAPEGLAALVQNRLNAPIASLALALIQAQTQGNPFFAEELVDALRDADHLLLKNDIWTVASQLVDALRDAGCLRVVDDGWTLALDAPLSAVDLGIPGTVQGIVLSRLDRLPTAAKLTLKVASVIGAVFEYELLVKAHPLRNMATLLPQHMGLLLARDFARIETPEPRLSYIFKHNITQEVAYQTLLEEQRYDLHLAVANELAALQPDKIEALAFHYANSDLSRPPVRAKALRYLDAAGQRAKRDYANETALGYFNRALALEARWPWLKAKIEILHILGRREEEAATLALLQAAPNASPFDTALLWGEYYEAVSEYAQAQGAVKTALAQAQHVGDQEGEARCLARLGMIAWSQGDFEISEEAYSTALVVIGSEDRFRDVEAEARRGLGLIYRQQGKYEEARNQFERDLALNQMLGNRPGEARALHALGVVEFYRRNIDSAVAYYRQAQFIHEAVGNQTGVASCLFSIGPGASTAGDYAEAEVLLQKALQIYERINDRWWQLLTWNELGVLYLVVGQYVEAQHCLLQGLELSQAIGADSGEAYLLCNLGQIHRELGDLVQAETRLQAALQMAVVQHDAQLEAICYSDLAIGSLRAADYMKAIERAQLSLAKFRVLDLELSTTADLGTLAAAHLGLGDHIAAGTYATQAITLLDGCGGEGPDFPQRDYWVCYQVFQAVGVETLALSARVAAHRLLMAKADKIADPNMRQSFLYNIAHNRTILAATE